MRDYACYKCFQSADQTIEKCLSCDEPFNFPLKSAPVKIGKYKVIEALGRGFYGTTYIVENNLKKKQVLKVIPVEIYIKHNKNFQLECEAHADAADGTIHIVNIHDLFEEEIEFLNGVKIKCHVAILDYIEGRTLKAYMEAQKIISANTIAQIVVDMFKILDILAKKQINHNDLHEENLMIEDLSSDKKRAEEIDNSIRVVAIDLGSISDENKSGGDPSRSSDIHWVSMYLKALSEKLLNNQKEISDQDYRLALLFENYAKILLPNQMHQRIPKYEEIISEIKDTYYMQTMPWNEELNLKNFSDGWNAQTLDPWFIPDLMVDVGEEWLNKVSAKGPLVITGMRGCGKTMLLKALQFHARVKNAQNYVLDIDKRKKIDFFKKDGFVGLYVNCGRLLDEPGTNKDLFEPLTRLFVAYTMEAIRALRHLRDIDVETVRGDFYRNIVDVCINHIEGFASDIIDSDIVLEKRLFLILTSLNKKEKLYKVKGNAVNIFPDLALAIRQSSRIFSSHYILFLLDDVSTRYLTKENIEELLSSLIFQDEMCSFKFTSEIQTIEQKLYSPGQIEKAKIGRDIDTFDLGGAVNDKLRKGTKNGGNSFILSILNKRKKYSKKHPPLEPSDLLGNTNLKAIAESIAKRKTKRQKKEIYYGLSALTGVCVGDIGDTIFLYDKILEKYKPNEVPIAKSKQNECFQELCSSRLHEINNRGSDLKDYALSFAKASHDLLIKSRDTGRLRIYSSIYIRIEEGDKDVYEKIRELIDAGIFVFSGGANTPRTVGNDTNPINQFVLKYRKILGLSNLIGLTQADRFELSGKTLRSWIEAPEQGRDILVNTVGGADDIEELEENYSESTNIEVINSFNQKKSLLDFIQEDSSSKEELEDSKQKVINANIPKVSILKDKEVANLNPKIYITALGFEERTFASVKKCLESIKPNKVILIEYEEEGKSTEIIDFIEGIGISYEIMKYNEVKTSINLSDETTLIDISGMSKSLIFNITRNILANTKKAYIAYTSAENHYPLDDEIEEVLNSIQTDNIFDALDEVTQKIQKGEDLTSEKIELYNLLLSDSDESKQRVVVACSNEKYEKLFKLLESRDFDIVNLLSSSNNSHKKKLADMASKVIKTNHPSVYITEVDSDDLKAFIKILTEKYFQYYLYQNSNLEFALTGSKIFTVACAAISSKFKISQCWYLAPSQWNIEEFSKGVGDTTIYKIEL